MARYVGQVHGSIAKFRDAEGGKLIDPDVVQFWFLSPSNTFTLRTHGVDAITNPGVGLYRSDFELSESGTYYWGWASSGTGQAAAEGSVVVAETKKQ